MKLSDFKDLSPVEQGLVDWLRAGNRQVYEVSDGVPDTATEANTIRATLIRYLALGGCDACRPPATGVQVRGAWIKGDDVLGAGTPGLDFEGECLRGDLGLFDCHIPDLILLRSAKLRNLYLNGSTLAKGLDGDRLTTEGAVFLRGAKVDGEIRLLGAQIGGVLDCSGAELRAKGKALRADRARITGGVFLRETKSDGAIRLMGAQIGGVLDCSGAELRVKDDTLRADSARITGGVFLRETKSDGAILLLGAQIGVDLDCSGAELRAKGNALSAEGAQITGSLFLRDGAKVTGRVSLIAAELSAISDDPACWPPSIELDRCRYGAFLGDNAPTDAKRRLDWLSRIPTEEGEFWPDPYEHCAKVLREMGHTSDARELLIEKERLQRKARRAQVAKDLQTARRDRAKTPAVAGLRLHTDRVIGHWMHLAGLRVWDGILGAVVGYGRKPQNAAYWALSMLVIGWIVFAHAAGYGAIKPNLPQVQLNPAWVDCANDPRGQLDCFLNAPQAASYPRFNAFIYSADTLIPVVTLEMQSYWIPDDRSDRGMLVRAYLWFHIAMGWALTLLAVAGFSGLIKTDSK